MRPAGATGAPDLSVVICSLNGAGGVRRCLAALAAAQTAAEVEVILVDDGSTDATSAVGESFGVVVIRHERNRGLAAARNAGVRRARGEIVAFLDDDCEPDPRWASRLLAAYRPDVIGVGGQATPRVDGGYLGRFLTRNNPLRPLELELSRSHSPAFRLWLYLRAQATIDPPAGRRAVSTLVGANMSFRRRALIEIGLFDERFRFGAEELDLCWRMLARFPSQILLVEPGAVVEHRFACSLSDIRRRARAYGVGAARLCRKWPQQRPALFPSALIVPALVAGAVRRPRWLGWALIWPLVGYPSAARRAVRDRRPEALLDAYLRLVQEHESNLGFLRGLWEFRHLVPETPGQAG